MTSHPRALVALAAAGIGALLLAMLPLDATAGGGSSPGAGVGQTTSNPISQSFADTFADPAVIQGKDGWWYAYSTADPLVSGGEFGIMHIARTKDFAHWDYRGTVFTDENRPDWVTDQSFLWAPDIRYVDRQYVLYFTATDTTLNAGGDPGIGVATAPNPEGPWTATDGPIVDPRPKADGSYYATIDPAFFTDVKGQNYLYWSSFNGGGWVQKVSRDGLSATSEPTQILADNRFEGPYIQRHGEWYYLLASSANCCAGPSTGYTVYAGRAKSPMGPFVDADGIPLNQSRAGGTTVITPMGNRWIGTGHHAVATDLTGRDFMVYHAIDRNQPWLKNPFGINRRPMLIDRLDWIDGWPTVRAGLGASDTPQAAPTTTSAWGIDSADPAGSLPGSTRVTDPQSGDAAALDGTATIRQPKGSKGSDGRGSKDSGTRIRLDLKGDSDLRVSYGGTRIEVGDGILTVRDGRSVRSTELRATAGWQTLTVELSDDRVLAQVSESDLGDPSAEVSLRPERHRGHHHGVGRDGIRFTSDGVLIDNLSVAPLATETKRKANRTPAAGRTLFEDDFSAGPRNGWAWLRPDDAITSTRGSLDWPVQDGDLVGQAPSTPSLLLRTPPAGDWVAETKVRLPLGTDTVRNFQQAGLVVHVNDNDFARLGVVAIGPTRQVEFGRELVDPTANDGRTIYGEAPIGTPGTTTWLRIAHTTNEAGENLYRAASSTDGRNWHWGGTWTFPADVSPTIGLYAHGGSDPAVTAQFDHFRITQLR